MIGRPPLAYEKSVFINCPFDSEYRELMLAIVFFVSDLAGFDPARHDSSAPSIIREVSAWLRTLDDVLDPAPSALRILQSFPSFAMSSPIYERRLWTRKRGLTFCWRHPRAFRVPEELLGGGRL